MYRGGDHPPPELPPGEHHGVQREEGGGDVTAVGQVAAAAQHLPPAPGDHYWECSEFSIIFHGTPGNYAHSICSRINHKFESMLVQV